MHQGRQIFNIFLSRILPKNWDWLAKNEAQLRGGLRGAWLMFALGGQVSLGMEGGKRFECSAVTSHFHVSQISRGLRVGRRVWNRL